MKEGRFLFPYIGIKSVLLYLYTTNLTMKNILFYYVKLCSCDNLINVQFLS